MTAVPTIEQILNQKQTYSDFSDEPSFTLTDILEEPLDEQLIEDIDIHEDDMDDFFQDDDEPDQQLFPLPTQSKVYQFPSLQQQISHEQQQPALTEQNQSQGNINISSVNHKTILSSQSKIRTSKIITGGSKVGSQSQTSQISPHERLKKLPLLPVQQIENMSFVKLKNVTNLFEDPSNTSLGIPTCISATGNRFLAVGTSMGNIVIFQIGVKGNKILGNSQQKKFGYVSSISISRDNKYLVAGHESGLVTLWDLYYFTLLKQEINSRAKILQVLFCSTSSQHFLSNDLEGNTYIYTIQKYLWLNLKSQKLLQKSPHLFYDIRYHELQSANSLLVLSTIDYVLLISVKPKISVIGKIIRPEGITSNYLPNVQMGRCVVEGLGYRGEAKPMYDILLVSWGKSLFIYRFMPSVNSFGIIEQLYVYKHPSVIYNIEYLSENIFVTLDKHQIFRTIRIDITLPSALQSLEEIQLKRHQGTLKQTISQEFVTINMPSTLSKQPTLNLSVIHSMEIDQEVIYQRFIKTKEQKYIKTFRNTLINCTFNSDQKEIFFITKNSVFRARLHKWTTFLSSVVNQQKNLKMAMKLAIELKDQQLNIFSEKVQVTGKKAEKSINMFCEIGKIFIEEGLKDVKQSNIERARNRQRAELEVKEIADDLKELYEYAIEYLIELRCEKYLFQTIYGKIIKNLPSFEYWQLFIEALKSFILAEKLTRIPSIEVFKQILDYFSQKKSNTPGEDNMKLIDKMITNLDSQSLHYENAVSILAQNKLYKGLAYMCSVNKDFVSPCNKLLMRMIEASQNKLDNAEREFFDILDDYLTKLLNGEYINQKKIPSRIYETNVLKDISLWLSFEDTLSYFLKGHSQSVKAQNSEQIPNPSIRIQKLLGWVSKLLELSAKQRQKDNFHSLSSHLIQALDTVDEKELMKKSAESVQKRLNITYLRYELSLMFLIHGSSIQLQQPELSFYLKYQYKNEVKLQKPFNKQVKFTRVNLNDQMSFMKKYFKQLHLISLQENEDTSKTAYTKLCQTKNDLCKYLYNFLIVSLSETTNKEDNERFIEESVRNQEQGQQQTKPIERKLSGVMAEQIETKSEKLQQSRSARKSDSSVKSAQLIENKQLIKSLFSNSNQILEVTYQQNGKQQKQALSQKFLALSLQTLPVSLLKEKTIQNSHQSPSTIQNNYLLVDFIIKNFTFSQIDSFIESLIKLNSELVIVFMLEHYQLQMVNTKIQTMDNEEVKYFVVRKILKMIRKIKKQQHYNTNSNKPSKGKPFRVWGNEFSTYQKKKTQQTLSYKSSIQKLSSSTLSKPILIFYLNCLCRFKPQKRVYAQLKDNIGDYEPFISEVLDIMKQFQLNSCIGLIYEHMNQLEDAFESYQLVYDERMELNVKKLVMVQHCHGRFLKKIFSQMLDICLKINNNRQWMRLLEAVLKPLTETNKYSRKKGEPVIELIQKVYTANQNHAFIQEFGSVIQSTLLEVSSHIPVEQISSVFTSYAELMNKTYMLNCLKSTMHTYSKSIFIYETSKEMVINDQASEFQRIYHENKIKGISCLAICENCQELIETKDKMILYKCSHMYHRRCVLPDQDKCLKCVLVEVGETNNYEKSSWDLEELKNKKKEESSSLKVIEGVSKDEEKQIIQQIPYEQTQTIKSNTIYRCLAFDDYLQKDQIKFDQFRRDYDSYLAKYE